MRKLIVAIALIAVALPLAVSADENDPELSGGVIRLYDSGPEIMDDWSHVPVGLDDVYINSACGCLTVERSVNQVVTTSVTTDEQLASREIEVGLSGGGNYSNLYFYKNGDRLYLHHAADYAEISGPTSNLWILIVSP